jgi:hypothetical protein
MGITKRVYDKDDPRLDKFYDETPVVMLTFQLKVSNNNNPYELYYRERLDGDKDYNDRVMKDLRSRAECDMFNILTRLQAEDPDCEFQQWRALDQNGQLLHTSNTLTYEVKPQVGAK